MEKKKKKDSGANEKMSEEQGHLIQFKCDFFQFRFYDKKSLRNKAKYQSVQTAEVQKGPGFPYSIRRHQTSFHRLHQYFNEIPSMLLSPCTLVDSTLSARVSSTLCLTSACFSYTKRHLSLNLVGCIGEKL